jgi:hypothetical protein
LGRGIFRGSRRRRLTPGRRSGFTTLAINTADETFYAGGTFGGVAANSGDVLIMYTYAGDANLDGLVDAADYGYIDNYFQFPGSSGFANGDFNYDGIQSMRGIMGSSITPSSYRGRQSR